MPRWVGWCLIANVLANAVDMALTWWGMAAGHIFEMNPVLAPLLARSPLLGAVIKMACVLIGVRILAWAYPQRPRLTTGALVVISASMVVIMGMHAQWILAL